MKGYDIFNRYNSGIIAAQQRYLERVGLKRVERLFSAGVSLSRYLRHHEDSDVIFISAFLTGADEGDAGYGYGGYSDGEVDFLGNAHGEGDRVSHSENRRRNSGLSSDLRGLGYSFFKVKGNYGVKEDTFGVLNFVEDFSRFLKNLVSLGKKYKQNSILVVPCSGSGSLPFLYFMRNESVEYARSSDLQVLGEMGSKYFSMINGKRYSYSFGDEEVVVSSGLHPIRSGYSALCVIGERERLQGFRYNEGNAAREWPSRNNGVW
jgi:hypothetical protein